MNRGAMTRPLDPHQLAAEARRTARTYGRSEMADGRRLLRFAVEVERAIYEGVISPDAFPPSLLRLLGPAEARTPGEQQ